jgi:hypothetical protein
MADAKSAGWFTPDQIADDAELQLPEAGFGADGVLHRYGSTHHLPQQQSRHCQRSSQSYFGQTPAQRRPYFPAKSGSILATSQ